MAFFFMTMHAVEIKRFIQSQQANLQCLPLCPLLLPMLSLLLLPLLVSRLLHVRLTQVLPLPPPFSFLFLLCLPGLLHLEDRTFRCLTREWLSRRRQSWNARSLFIQRHSTWRNHMFHSRFSRTCWGTKVRTQNLSSTLTARPSRAGNWTSGTLMHGRLQLESNVLETFTAWACCPTTFMLSRCSKTYRAQCRQKWQACFGPWLLSLPHPTFTPGTLPFAWTQRH